MGVVLGVKTFIYWMQLCAVCWSTAAVSTNYLFNPPWSFKGTQSTPIIRGDLIFVTVCCVGFAAHPGAMHLLIVYADLDGGYKYILTNFIGVVVGTLVNYTGGKFLAFSPAGAG